MNLQNDLAIARERSAVLLCCVALLACGEATCPDGSVSRDGDCVPIETTCADGEEPGDGGCMRMSGIRADAGGDHDASAEHESDAGSATTDPCDELDCGAHGRCESGGAAGACVCDPGFAGKLCETCEPGLGLSSSGACVPACEAEAAPDCGTHGSCEVIDDVAHCTCDRGFDGETCGECGEGFQADEDGSCVPFCGGCGPHEICDEEAETPTCVCTVGYRYEGDECRWAGNGENGGGLVDAELEDPNAWQTQHAAIDRGAATFINAIVDGQCELGSLGQRFEMPPLEQAEPLVLELVVTTICRIADPLQCPALLVETGSSVTRVQVPGGSVGATRTISLCLGEAAYGGAIDLRIRPSIASGARGASPAFFDCENDAWPVVESVGIRAAKLYECPLDVRVRNGAFDYIEGWTVQSGAITRGQLALEADGTAETQAAFPLASSMPSAALRIRNTSAARPHLVVSLDGLVWNFALPESGAAVSLCAPDWAQGSVHTLHLQSTTAATLEAISIEPDPACDDGRFDRGFEREVDGTQVAMHGSWEYVGGYPNVRQEAAYSGSHGMRMTGAANGIRALTRVPESTSAGGAAFAFMHRINDPAVVGTLQVLPFAPTYSQLNAARWTPSVICLDREWQGQLMSMSFSLALSGSAAGIDIDDAGPTIDESCE